MAAFRDGPTIEVGCLDRAEFGTSEYPRSGREATGESRRDLRQGGRNREAREASAAEVETLSAVRILEDAGTDREAEWRHRFSGAGGG